MRCVRWVIVPRMVIFLSQPNAAMIWAQAMNFKPDYGLMLVNRGFGPNVDHLYYNFPLLSLTILGPGRYSTTVEQPFEGQMYALSLDFNEEQLEAILSKASTDLRLFLHDAISRDPATPRAIDFTDSVSFGVRAHLGRVQQGERESFVPLVVQEVL